MKFLQGLDGLKQLPPGTVLTIGNFDGMHLGHQSLLALARRLRAQRPEAALAVTTFEPHPLTVLRPGKAPPRLTPPQYKRDLLMREGVDALVELPPEPAVLNLTAEQFWAILRDEVRPSNLVEGEEFSFGKGRTGNVRRLREWSENSDVRLHIVGQREVALLDLRVVGVSSTVIRWLLAYGRVRDAAICLGRPYALHGPVIKGHQRGREMGIPTANLRCDAQLVPADGVYAGRCSIAGREYPTAVSIGTVPTFGDSDRQIEAHLIGFDGNLYDQTISVELVDWLREQQKYSSLDALMVQIVRDIEQCVVRMADNLTQPIGAV